MTVSGNFERFQCDNFETDFLQNENLFEKNRFSVGSTKIEHTSLPYKTAISEANVKTNRMVSTKLTCYKVWSFASNYFNFLKILF